MDRVFTFLRQQTKLVGVGKKKFLIEGLWLKNCFVMTTTIEGFILL